MMELTEYTIEQAANELGLSQSQVLKIRRKRQLGYKRDNRWIIPIYELAKVRLPCRI